MSADNWTDCPKCLNGNFREDYEIGSHNGNFFADYNGECQSCGYLYKFNVEKPLIEKGQ